MLVFPEDTNWNDENVTQFEYIDPDLALGEKSSAKLKDMIRIGQKAAGL